jgi:hypothetical protein
MEIKHRNTILSIEIIGIIALILMVAIMTPVGIDWQTWNIESVTQLRAPYDMPDFTGMPFAFFALPHAALNIEIGNAVNVGLNILAVIMVANFYAGKDWYKVTLIVLSSPFGMLLVMVNNIDWIPLMSFVLADWLAYPMLAMKPQMLAGAAIIRFKRHADWTQLIPLAFMLACSVLIWGAWWQRLGNGLFDAKWNYAPFPYMIPVGVYLLWQAWKRNDDILAACSTMFFVPYFAPYSLAGVHTLITSRDRRIGVALWLLAWWLFIRSARMI